jgi:hypothetical protein
VPHPSSDTPPDAPAQMRLQGYSCPDLSDTLRSARTTGDRSRVDSDARAPTAGLPTLLRVLA